MPSTMLSILSILGMAVVSSRAELSPPQSNTLRTIMARDSSTVAHQVSGKRAIADFAASAVTIVDNHDYTSIVGPHTTAVNVPDTAPIYPLFTATAGMPVSTVSATFTVFTHAETTIAATPARTTICATPAPVSVTTSTTTIFVHPHKADATVTAYQSVVTLTLGNELDSLISFLTDLVPAVVKPNTRPHHLEEHWDHYEPESDSVRSVKGPSVAILVAFWCLFVLLL